LHVDPDGVFSSCEPSLLAGTEARLQQLVSRLLDDDELRARLAGRLRCVALEQYTEANAQQLVDILVA
jgi:hypothetical protein